MPLVFGICCHRRRVTEALKNNAIVMALEDVKAAEGLENQANIIALEDVIAAKDIAVEEQGRNPIAVAEDPLPLGVQVEALDDDAQVPEGHRLYVVWSVPRWANLLGIHVGPDTSAYHGLFSLGPNGKRLPFKSIVFKRITTPSFAEARRVLIEERPAAVVVPQDIKVFRWPPKK